MVLLLSGASEVGNALSELKLIVLVLRARTLMLLIEVGNGIIRRIMKERISLRALRVVVQLERLACILVGSTSDTTTKATTNLVLIRWLPIILPECLLVVLLLLETV